MKRFKSQINEVDRHSVASQECFHRRSRWKFRSESILEPISECWVIRVLNGTTQGMQCHLRAPSQEKQEEEEAGETEERQ